MRLLWLADVLRGAGLTVVEHSGWRTRGWEPWQPRYGIVHATAAPRTQTDATQVAIVRDGHSKLQGPIANCCLDRSGRWHVLASGRCNTAKTGWAGPASGLGNTNLLGVEACNDNVSEPWPAVQYDAYVRGWTAICARMGWDAARCVGHKEHQPGDKSDPTFNMDTFRRRVAEAMEDDMPLTNEDLDRISHAVWARENPNSSKKYVHLLLDVWRRTASLVADRDGTDVADVLRAELAAHRAELLETLGDDLADALAAKVGVSPEAMREAVRVELRERDQRAAGQQ